MSLERTKRGRNFEEIIYCNTAVLSMCNRNGKTVYAASDMEVSSTKQPGDKVKVVWNSVDNAEKGYCFFEV